jgi:hypothetical protein
VISKLIQIVVIYHLKNKLKHLIPKYPKSWKISK